MKTPRFLPWISASEDRRFKFGPIDLFVFIAIGFMIWIIGSLGHDMTAPLSPDAHSEISLDLWHLPYYAARSTLRMFIAYFFSLIFTMIIGWWTAHSKRARVFLLPALDILQSVPVLGFLSVTVTGFMSLFPGSLLGVECASLFAIFTGQVWNMIFGFYHSLVTIPDNLSEAASSFHLNPWQRFKWLELPSGAISLIWNSMMSFGGGWFFVVQSEAITVLHQDIKLPGIGSYMSVAMEKGDNKAALAALVAMIVIIVVTDQLLWKPVIAWSQKFKNEQVEGSEVFTSWFLEVIRRAGFIRTILVDGWQGLISILDKFFSFVLQKSDREFQKHPVTKKYLMQLYGLGIWFLIGSLIWLGIKLGFQVKTSMSSDEILHIAWLGILTMMRVFVMVLVATLIWTPIGVWIGFRPKMAKIIQPFAQIAASFPVNLTFPFVVGFFVAHSISMDWGSILLLALGTQWYILFNVIAGAMSVPSDLKETAAVFHLSGLRIWKTLIIPAIFPYWVTGACTAAGGAWNASIVAEFASWGQNKLVAKGLGAFIAQATEKGDWPAIFCSILIMSLFVVVLNRLLWRNLYDYAEKRFRLD